MSHFEYKHSLKLTSDQFAETQSLLKKETRRIRRLVSLLFGIACLFSPYTIVLGIALLFLLALVVFIPKKAPSINKNRFKEFPHLHKKLTHEVTDSELRIHGKEIDFRCSWPNLRFWQLKNNWLILSPNGMPMLLFNITDLKNKNVYDEILSLAKMHGFEYGHAEQQK